MAERITLEQFQAELTRKLADSAQRPLAAGWLGVAWQGVRALVPLAQAGEIFNPSALQRLPHTQPWVQGVASLRGGLTVVVDWVRLLGLQAQVKPLWGDQDVVYWVSLNPALGVGAALCVDRLLGLRGSNDHWTAEPQPAAHPALRQGWRDAEGSLWYELDLAVLAQCPDFLDPRHPAFAVVGSTT